MLENWNQGDVSFKTSYRLLVTCPVLSLVVNDENVFRVFLVKETHQSCNEDLKRFWRSAQQSVY